MSKVNGLNTISHKGVLEKFLSYPEEMRIKLLHLRELIFKVAKTNSQIGKIEETLKWQEPSYLTSQTKSGSTIRIDWKQSCPNQYFMYFNCNTFLIGMFKEIYGDLFKYGGNRSIIFDKDSMVAIKELSHCIKIALTYNLRKKIICL